MFGVCCETTLSFRHESEASKEEFADGRQQRRRDSRFLKRLPAAFGMTRCPEPSIHDMIVGNEVRPCAYFEQQH